MARKKQPWKKSYGYLLKIEWFYFRFTANKMIEAIISNNFAQYDFVCGDRQCELADVRTSNFNGFGFS